MIGLMVPSAFAEVHIVDIFRGEEASDECPGFLCMSNKNLEIESNDMLRFVEHGRKVKIVESPDLTLSVDVPSDIEKVELLMQNDDLFSLYS